MINSSINTSNSSSIVRQINNPNNSSERLSTGKRINRASDDVAGLSISESLINQIRGLEQALRNTNDGASLIRTAEGSTGQINEILGRVRELTVQASNDSIPSSVRNTIYSEISQMLGEVNNVSSSAQFNNINILSEDMNIGLQTGSNAGQHTNLVMSSMNLSSLGLTGFADLFERASQDNVLLGGQVTSSLIGELDNAINIVSSARSALGAVENRLQHTSNNLSNSHGNTSQAMSQIRDADMAKEAINNYQNIVQQQASMVMLMHSNLQIGSQLRLLG